MNQSSVSSFYEGSQTTVESVGKNVIQNSLGNCKSYLKRPLKDIC